MKPLVVTAPAALFAAVAALMLAAPEARADKFVSTSHSRFSSGISIRIGGGGYYPQRYYPRRRVYRRSSYGGGYGGRIYGGYGGYRRPCGRGYSRYGRSGRRYY